MATSSFFDKSLNQAPMGLSDRDELEESPGIEIEIEDPESVAIGLGGLEIVIGKEKDDIGDEDFNANLAEAMDEKELATMANDW